LSYIPFKSDSSKGHQLQSSLYDSQQPQTRKFDKCFVLCYYYKSPK